MYKAQSPRKLQDSDFVDVGKDASYQGKNKYQTVSE